MEAEAAPRLKPGTRRWRHALEDRRVLAPLLIAPAVLFIVRDFRGKWLVRFLVILPWAAPVVLSTITWLWVLDSLYSVANWTLDRLHLDGALIWTLGALNIEENAQAPLQWLGRPNLALLAITLVPAWRILPFAGVIFLAGRASIPTEVEDAAEVDGATGIKKLWYVDVPLQAPIALVAVLFGIVFTAGDFAVVYILTAGGPFNSTQVLPTWAFQIGINSGSLGEGAAISLYLFPLLVVVSVAMLFFARRVQVA